MNINMNNLVIKVFLLLAPFLGKNNIVAMDDGKSLFQEAMSNAVGKNNNGLSNQTTGFKNPRWRKNTTLVSFLFDIRKIIGEYEAIIRQKAKSEIGDSAEKNMSGGMGVYTMSTTADGSINSIKNFNNVERSSFEQFIKDKFSGMGFDVAFTGVLFAVDRFLSSIENFKYIEIPLFDQFLSVGKAVKEISILGVNVGNMMLNNITSQGKNNEDDQKVIKLFNDVFTSDSFAKYFDKNVKKEHEAIKKDVDKYMQYSQIYSAYFIFFNHLLFAIKDFESIQDIIDNGEKHWYLKNFVDKNEMEGFRKKLSESEFDQNLIKNLDEKEMLAKFKDLLMNDKKISTMNNLLNKFDTEEKRKVLDWKLRQLTRDEKAQGEVILDIIKDKEDMSFRESLEGRIENFIIDILNRMPELIKEMQSSDV